MMKFQPHEKDRSKVNAIRTNCNKATRPPVSHVHELRWGSSHYDFPCNRLRSSYAPITLLSPFILPFHLGLIALRQIDASPILNRIARCIDAVLLTTVFLSSLSGEPLRSLTTRSVSLTRRSPSSHLALSLSRSLLTNMVSRPFLL